MLRALTAACALGALTLSGCAVTPTIDVAAAPAGAYALDPTHASVIWRVAHAGGLSQYTARFDTLEGALDFNPDAPAASQVDIRIDAASVSTGLPAFDAQLAAANDVFNADAHRQIRFVSKEIEVTGPQTGLVTGDLTLRGQTQPVTLDVTYNGSAFDPLRRVDLVGFSATGSFSRAAFGADAWSSFGVGDTVTVLIEAEFIKQ